MNQENWNAEVAAKMAELDQAIEAGNFRLLPLDLEKSMMKVLENSGCTDAKEIEIAGDVDS